MKILFAHGAGASSESDWMRAWKTRLDSIAPTTSFDYPYMKSETKRRPDRLPKLIESHREELNKLKAGPEVVLAGKSMGSRVGCHLSLTDSVRALVCFGFPLVSVSGKSREEVLLNLSTPILFVSGTKDRLCPLAELERVRASMSAPNQLHIVDGGDHSLRVGKRLLKSRGETQEDVDERMLEAVRSFLS